MCLRQRCIMVAQLVGYGVGDIAFSDSVTLLGTNYSPNSTQEREHNLSHRTFKIFLLY